MEAAGIEPASVQATHRGMFYRLSPFFWSRPIPWASGLFPRWGRPFLMGFPRENGKTLGKTPTLTDPSREPGGKLPGRGGGQLGRQSVVSVRTYFGFWAFYGVARPGLHPAEFHLPSIPFRPPFIQEYILKRKKRLVFAYSSDIIFRQYVHFVTLLHYKWPRAC
jgi:hypothetical protein